MPTRIPITKGGLTITVKGEKLEWHAADSATKRRKTLRALIMKNKKTARKKALSVMRALVARLNLGRKRMRSAYVKSFEADINWVRSNYLKTKKVKNPKTKRMIYRNGMTYAALKFQGIL